MQNLLVGSRCPSFLFFLYVAGAATIFELSRLFTRVSGNPLSVAAVLIKPDVIPISNTDYVLLRIY